MNIKITKAYFKRYWFNHNKKYRWRLDSALRSNQLMMEKLKEFDNIYCDKHNTINNG